MLLKFKGKNKLETAENYSILSIFIGARLLSIGIGLNIVSTKGLSAILAMLGAVVSFVSIVSLIVIWLIREFEKEHVEKV